MGWISTIIGFLGGFWSFATRVFDYLKENALMNQGRSLERAEIEKQEAEIQREQVEILTSGRTKEDVIKKMQNGEF